MHCTRTESRGVFAPALTLAVVVVVLGMLIAGVPTAFAAGSFTGGADQYPLYLANDHTPVAIHFWASGLETNTAYYLKARFCPNPTPGGGQQYGYDWNPTTGQWVQERASWLDHVRVTTNASGEITSNAGWIYATYGYTGTPSGTPRYIVVSLSKTGSSDTSNSAINPVTTVIDPRDAGGWVHNGIATGISFGKNAQVTSDTASNEVYSIQKTEGNGLDDDFDGIVDNEDYGPVGATGDFRVGVPSNISADIRLWQNPWAPGDNFVTGPHDVDLAIGASDATAPDAPTGLTATPSSNKVALDWTAAYDNPGGSGVAGYNIYRWRDSMAGSTWTDIHKRVATVTAGTTSYEDTQAVNGQTYSYEVRSVDESTNVSARSNTANATPDFVSTSLDVTASATFVSYSGATVLTGELTSTVGPVPGGMEVTVWRRPTGSATWSQDATATYDGVGERYVATRTCTANTVFQMRYAGATIYAACDSNEVTVSARAYLGRPWIYRGIVRRNRSFLVYGYLKPRHSGYTTLHFYRKVRGHWRYYTRRSATNYNYSSYTRYRLAYRLRYGGYYYVKARHSDANHAATWGPTRVFYVR